MSKNSKSQGLHPDAHPTAPGGMSRLALATELVEKHGWEGEPAKISRMHWPTLIQHVCDERLAREKETQANPPSLFIGMPTTRDYIFDGHAGAGPSGAERWMNCTASLGAARAFLETLTPNQQAEFAQSSAAARQGTTAHAVAEAEARLRLGETTDAELTAMLMELSVLPDTEGEAYSPEMAEYISEYVDLVQSFIDEGREVMVEKRVVATVELLTVGDEGEYDLHDIAGSADLVVVPTPVDPVLVVGDLKYGEGVEVEVEANPQIRIYALGVLAEVVERYGELPDWLEDVEYIIAQPRLGGVKTWTEKVDDLLDWSTEVLSPALTEALGGLKAGAKFVPGEVQCQFCPARGSCPALAESRIEAATELFDTIQATEYETGIEGAFPETESLSDERLASLYSQAKAVADLAKAMKDEVQRRLHRGVEIPGFHLVNYTPPRHWSSEAAEELRDMAGLWASKLVTPTQAEKMLGEEYESVEHLVVKPEIRPVAAPVNDRRKKWAGLPPEQMFSNLDEEE